MKMIKRTIIWLMAVPLLLSIGRCLPKPPVYPHADPEVIEKEAQIISDRLEDYILQWLDGKVPASIPEELLPKGYNNKHLKNFRLVKYEDIDPERQFVIRERHEINFDSLYGSFPDPHCTYLVLPALLVPFKSKVIIEGEFPYARFFDIQVTPPFDGREYRYDRWAGKGEVAIVDVDIEPNTGHVNPFRVGSNRYAGNRKYQVVYEMAIGNPVDLNPFHKPPHYRGKGNFRYGGAIHYQGPWGTGKGWGHGRGVWDIGDVWIRYYGVDKQKNALAGVPLPKVYYQLPGGEKFYIDCDYDAYAAEANKISSIRTVNNNHPASYHGPEVGWGKQFDIFHAVIAGLSQALYKKSEKSMAYIRDLHLGVTGRGENQQPPANYEPHATGCVYIHYLLRGMAIKKGYVAVLTGKLPTFPDTRNGATKMDTAQCRYWSLTSYDAGFPFNKIAGVELTSVMDDEITLDQDRNFILVYSRPEDKPANASAANGVTWVNWGSVGIQSFTLRWLSVGPEWMMDIAPHEINLSWSQANPSSSNFDQDLIAQNGHQGFLGEYQPKVHYMSREDFEVLGVQLKAEQIPDWEATK